MSALHCGASNGGPVRGEGLPPVPPPRVRALIGRERAVEVVEVMGDSPAARAGLHAEDLIVAVDGEPVEGVDDLHRLMGGDRIGLACPLAVVRDGAVRDVLLTPRELVAG